MVKRTLHTGDKKRAGVFLDRDGVLNEEVGYLGEVAQLRLLPGVSKAVKALNDHGIPVIVATNQSGIGRGLFPEERVEQIHAAVARMLAAEGAEITRFCYCPHHPTEANEAYRIECECRKPKPGMLIQAARELGLDLQQSVMVGDKMTDIEAGWQAGCRTVLVSTGYGTVAKQQLCGYPHQPDHFAAELTDAVDWIIRTMNIPRSTPLPTEGPSQGRRVNRE